MKVAYDISVLGHGHYHDSSRAGIFRVVEKVAQGLATSGECDLSLCATESLHALRHSFRYLRSGSRLAGVPFRHSEFRTSLGLLAQDGVRDLSLRIERSRGFGRSFLRTARKSLFSTGATLDLGRLVDPRMLREVDVFHSPFHAIPPEVRQAEHLQRFLTVHDLVPLLFPHFCVDGQDRTNERILASVGDEDWILCVSQATKDDLCNYRPDLDPRRMTVIPWAAEQERFYPCSDPQQIAEVRQRYGIPDAPYLLSVSTLEPRKNFDHVIRSFAALVEQERLDDLHLVLVGTKGWKYGKIFDELSRYKWLQDRILITGYVDDDDLAPLYSGALAFVYMSFYEGFGLPPLEAMQCGVPVITSNTSALPEVVGDAGIMLDPADQEALCQSILDIYRQPSLRGSMGQKSLARAKRFSWERCIRQTLAAYRTSLSADHRVVEGHCHIGPGALEPV